MNTRYAVILALGLAAISAGSPTTFAGPGGLAGTPSNGSAVAGTVGVGSGAVVASPGSVGGGMGARNAPSAPVNGASVRGGGGYSSLGSYTLYSSSSASPVVRSQARPQLSSTATPGVLNRSNLPVRQAYIQSDRRTSAGLVPSNRYTIQSRVAPTTSLNRYGNNANYQNLTQADLNRAAADRNTGKLTGKLTFSTADRGQDGDRRHDPRRNNIGIYYGNYFPGAGYGYYSPYSAYPYYSGLTYGYPYSVLTAGSYLSNSYGFSGGDYTVDSAIPDDSVSIEQTIDNTNQADTPRSGTIPPQSDTLVQDVQAELARRGYFAGKIDGIVSTAFQAALRRFQTDLKLTPTGLINQASLFALGLN